MWASATFVPDIERKPRLVVYPSYQIGYLEDCRFRYETLASFVAQLEPGDNVVS